jgi:hypothetical protein
LELAGLAGEPGVKPMSIPAAFARRVYDTTKDITAVADALGRRDLDSAARMIGLDWHKDPEERRAQLEASVLGGESRSTTLSPGVRREHRRSSSGRKVRQPDSTATAPGRRPRTVPAVNVTKSRPVQP